MVVENTTVAIPAESAVESTATEGGSKISSLKAVFNEVSEKISPTFKEKMTKVMDKIREFKDRVVNNEYVQGAVHDFKDRLKTAMEKLGTKDIEQNAQAENQGPEAGA